jgi:hypothetical protein
MGRALSPEELDALLGAYALDALDADERAPVEEWLARSPNARRDADELRETASLLAQATADLPTELWARIESRLGDADHELDVPPLRLSEVVDLGARRVTAASTSARSARRPWLVGIAAAVALAVAVTVGVVVGREVSDQDARIDRLAAGMEDDAMEQAALAAAMEPGARSTRLEAATGAVLAKVVTTADGRGYFMADEMPSLPAGRTYQLWALMGEDLDSAVVSVGVLGRDPTVMAFNADPGVQGFVVTEEDAPGVAESTQPAMAEGWLA